MSPGYDWFRGSDFLPSHSRFEVYTSWTEQPSIQIEATSNERSNARKLLSGKRVSGDAPHCEFTTPAEIDKESWERVVRDSGAHSRQAILADIGLGRLLPAVVARRLLRKAEREDGKGGQPTSAEVSKAPQTPPASGPTIGIQKYDPCDWNTAGP